MAESFNFGVSLTGFEQEAQKGWARAQRVIRSRPLNIGINDKASLPLGRISAAAGEVDKSIGVATQRVVAFGIAAGGVLAVRRAFEALFRATTQVEESITKINVNLGLTADQATRFTKEIFNIARNTGQSFADTAKAAEELARQGLSAEETQKRLSAAMMLSRMASIGSEEAVNSLTAAINSFSKESLSAQEILNKFVAVDTRFAVSTKDLEQAVSRVGSTATEAGVSFNELLAIVTSVQQTTARGGAVIGNAFKTIFTRLQRPKVLEDLEQIGVAVKDIQGNTLPAMQILKNLAAVYNNLTSEQRAVTSEQVAGVFQINILKAALSDLSKEYNTYNRALDASSNAIDEAIRKNQELNKTLATLLNATSQSFTQFLSALGNTQISFVSRNVIEEFNKILQFLSGANSEEAGKTFGQGILNGIANVLSGPAAFIAVFALGKAFSKVFQIIGKDVANIFNLNKAARERQIVQERINVLLKYASDQERIQYQAATSIAGKKQVLLGIEQRITAELERQNLAARNFQEAFIGQQNRFARTLGGSGIFRGPRKINISDVRNVAGGYLPIQREKQAISRGVGGASSSAKPVIIPNFAFGGGKRGPVVANTNEYFVPNYAGGASAIFNQNMVKSMGMPKGAKPINAAGGIIPNYANGSFGGGDALRSSLTGRFLSKAQLEALNTARELYRKALEENSKVLKKDALDLAKTVPLTKDSRRKLQLALEEDAKTVSELKKIHERERRRQASVEQEEKTRIADLKKRRTAERNINQQVKSSLNDLKKREREQAKRSRAFQEQEQRQAAQSGQPYSVSNTGILSTGATRRAQQQAARAQSFRSLEQELEKSGKGFRGAFANIPFVGQGPQKTFEKILEQNKQLSTKQVRSLGSRLDAINERRTEASNKRLFGAAFLLPFLSGFIDEGTGGTLGGIGRGASSAGLQGLGFGALFGPKGALIGGTIGALYGAFTKLEKSTAEMAEEFDNITKTAGQRIQGISIFGQIQSEINAAVESGASENVIRALYQRLNDVNKGLDVDLVQKLKETGGELSKIEKLQQDENRTQEDRSRRQQAALGISGITKSFRGTLENLVADFPGGQRLLNLIGGERSAITRSTSSVSTKELDRIAQEVSKVVPAELAKSIDVRRLIQTQGDANEQGGRASIDDINFVQSVLDRFKSIGPEFENMGRVTADNLENIAYLLSRVSINAQKAAAATKEQSDETEEFARKLREASIARNIKSFLGVNLQGEAAFSQFGQARSPALFGTANRQANIEQAFLDAIERLDALDVGVTDPEMAKQIKTLTQQAQAATGQRKATSAAADFIRGFDRFRGISLTNDRGELNQKLIVAILETLKKSTDAQTKILASIFQEGIKVKSETKDLLGAKPETRLGPGYIQAGVKYTAYAGTRPASDSIETRYDMKGQSSVVNRIARSGTPEALAMFAGDKERAAAKIAEMNSPEYHARQRLIKNFGPLPDLKSNLTSFEEAASDIVSSADNVAAKLQEAAKTFQNTEISTENKFDVNIILSPEAMSAVSQQNLDIVKNEVMTAINTVAAKLSEVIGKPTPPTSSSNIAGMNRVMRQDSVDEASQWWDNRSAAAKFVDKTWGGVANTIPSPRSL